MNQSKVTKNHSLIEPNIFQPWLTVPYGFAEVLRASRRSKANVRTCQPQPQRGWNISPITMDYDQLSIMSLYLLVTIEGPVWYTIYHHFPVVKGVSSNPSINQPTNGKRTSMMTMVVYPLLIGTALPSGCPSNIRVYSSICP